MIVQGLLCLLAFCLQLSSASIQISPFAYFLYEEFYGKNFTQEQVEQALIESQNTGSKDLIPPIYNVYGEGSTKKRMTLMKLKGSSMGKGDYFAISPDIFSQWIQVYGKLDQEGGFWLSENEFLTEGFESKFLRKLQGASVVLNEQLVVKGAKKGLSLLKFLQQPVQTWSKLSILKPYIQNISAESPKVQKEFRLALSQIIVIHEILENPQGITFKVMTRESSQMSPELIEIDFNRTWNTTKFNWFTEELKERFDRLSLSHQKVSDEKITIIASPERDDWISVRNFFISLRSHHPNDQVIVVTRQPVYKSLFELFRIYEIQPYFPKMDLWFARRELKGPELDEKKREMILESLLSFNAKDLGRHFGFYEVIEMLQAKNNNSNELVAILETEDLILQRNIIESIREARSMFYDPVSNELSPFVLFSSTTFDEKQRNSPNPINLLSYESAGLFGGSTKWAAFFTERRWADSGAIIGDANSVQKFLLMFQQAVLLLESPLPQSNSKVKEQTINNYLLFHHSKEFNGVLAQNGQVIFNGEIMQANTSQYKEGLDAKGEMILIDGVAPSVLHWVSTLKDTDVLKRLDREFSSFEKKSEKEIRMVLREPLNTHKRVPFLSFEAEGDQIVRKLVCLTPETLKETTSLSQDLEYWERTWIYKDLSSLKRRMNYWTWSKESQMGIILLIQNTRGFKAIEKPIKAFSSSSLLSQIVYFHNKITQSPPYSASSLERLEPDSARLLDDMGIKELVNREGFFNETSFRAQDIAQLFQVYQIMRSFEYGVVFLLFDDENTTFDTSIIEHRVKDIETLHVFTAESKRIGLDSVTTKEEILKRSPESIQITLLHGEINKIKEFLLLFFDTFYFMRRAGVEGALDSRVVAWATLQLHGKNIGVVFE